MRLAHSNHYECITALELSGVGAEDFNFLASDSNRSFKSAKLLYHFVTGLLTIKMSGFITGLLGLN